MSFADMRFAHAAARVRVLELRMLDRGRIERLLDAAGVGEILHILAETEYGPAVAALKGGDDYEQVLTGELSRAYAVVGSFSPEPRLLQSWAARHAFHNLKALLKGFFGGQAAEDSALSALSPVSREQLEAVVAEAVDAPQGGRRPVSVPMPRVPSGPPQMRVGGTVVERVSGPEAEPYLQRAAAEAAAAFRTGGGPEEIDQAVDRVYQEYLLALATGAGAEFLRGWVVHWADLANLRTFCRYALAGREGGSFGRALLPGGLVPVDRLTPAYAGAEGSQGKLAALAALAASTPYAAVVAEGLRRFEAEGLLHGLERESDLFLLEYLRRAQKTAFGIAPVWAYLMGKEQEVRLLRLILVGKSAGLSREQLRERISDVYA